MYSRHLSFHRGVGVICALRWIGIWRERGLLVGEQVGGSWMWTVGRFLGEVVSGSDAATGNGVELFVGEDEGGPVEATEERW